MDGFSKLPKDNKTYLILKKYFIDLEKEKDLLEEDNEIQIQEIKDHNCRCGKDESIKWIDDNAKKERQYLNSIKFLIIIFHRKKLPINQQNFRCMVDNFNINWYPILNIDTDRILGKIL